MFTYGDTQVCQNYREIMLPSVSVESMDWDSSMYINFVDYKEAFNSLDRDTLWKFLHHYMITNKCISLIRNTYQYMACSIYYG